MKRSRFSEGQTLPVPKEHELGTGTAELYRKHGISEATFFNWKSKYGHRGVGSQAAEGAGGWDQKLKKLLAE
jgi:putative transposase